MGISIEADIPNRCRTPHQKVCFFSSYCSTTDSALTSSNLFFIKFGTTCVGQAQTLINIACSDDIGLMTVVFEELPLHYLRSKKLVRRKQFASISEKIEDLFELCECAGIVEHKEVIRVLGFIFLNSLLYGSPSGMSTFSHLFSISRRLASNFIF